MFTIGIFTTHLPYIAFVAFYAFFLFFGVSKASSGEFHSGDKMIPEFSGESKDIQLFKDSKSDFKYHSFSGMFFPESNKIPVFKEKLKISSFYPPGNEDFTRYLILFSRPPPCFS
jgi:hypothetical protein